MSARETQLRLAQIGTADDALRTLSDKETVQYALSLLLGVTDPAALPALAYSANRIKNHSDNLIRATFEMECG
jgi:hypothetical protein